jgi:hypothetical protein
MVATESHGLVTTAGVGTTTIGATLSGVSTSTTLTVTPATVRSIAVSPSSPSIAVGLTVQLTAIATFTDNSTQDVTQLATWVSMNGAIATVTTAGASRGLVTAVAVGMTNVSASFGGQSNSAMVNVTSAVLQQIVVSPASSSLPLGASAQFTAVGHYSDSSTLDLTTQVTWDSTMQNVAVAQNAVGSQGVVTAVGQGTTSITATLGGVMGSASLTVGPAQLVSIALSPMGATLMIADMQQYTATGLYTDNSTADLTALATWSSDNVTVASFGATAGLLTANATGTANVSAKYQSVTGTTGVTVQ